MKNNHGIANSVLIFILTTVIVLNLSPLVLADEQENKELLTDHPQVKEALAYLRLWLEAELDYEQYPSLTMAIVHDQELIWSVGLGYADAQNKVPATADTIYSICSISKLFTAISVMQLRDAGKLSLNDPVSKHLPWFKIEKTDPEAPPITVLSMLRHSSGLPRESDHPYWTGPEFDFPDREEIIAKLPGQVTLYPPDTYFQYSNLGLSLAGEVVSAASGMPFEEYVEKNLLTPLGLTNTTPFLPEDKHGAQMAVGYSRLGRKRVRERIDIFQAKGIAPAAGFASNALDLAAFASWQFKVLEKGDNLLNRYTLKEMHRVHWVDPDWKRHRGISFDTWQSNGTVFVGHSGSCPGYRTQLMLSPVDKIAVVFMTNAMGVNTRKYVEAAYNLLAPAIKSALDDKGNGAEKGSDLSKLTGLFHDYWGDSAMIMWKGQLASVYMPSSNPAAAITKLKRTGEYTFRRVRSDSTLGEEVVFELDEDGNVFRYKWHGNYSTKVKND